VLASAPDHFGAVRALAAPIGIASRQRHRPAPRTGTRGNVAVRWLRLPCVCGYTPHTRHGTG
jgi:hypothetical protein